MGYFKRKIRFTETDTTIKDGEIYLNSLDANRGKGEKLKNGSIVIIGEVQYEVEVSQNIMANFNINNKAPRLVRLIEIEE